MLQAIGSAAHQTSPAVTVEEPSSSLDSVQQPSATETSLAPPSLSQPLDLNALPPALVEQARKLALSGGGAQLLQQLREQGLDPQLMKDLLPRRAPPSGRKVVLITQTRQARSRLLPSNSEVGTLLRCLVPLQLPCSRLATGPLRGASLHGWYNPDLKGKNKRASRIMGFPVPGELLLTRSDGDLELEQFLTAETALQ